MFRKQILRGPIISGSEGQVLNRYPVQLGSRLTDAEVGVIAAQLFENDYGHPFTDDEDVYWTLEGSRLLGSSP